MKLTPVGPAHALDKIESLKTQCLIRDHIIALEEENEKLKAAVGQLLQWDDFDSAGDGKYWRDRLTALIGKEGE